MKAKNRKCTQCKQLCLAEDALVSHLKAFCSYECLKEYTQNTVKKQKSKEQKSANRKQREKLKTRSQWMREAQTAFNAYVRARDKAEPCISCGKFTEDDAIGGKWDCGHYRSVGSAPHLRFCLINAHKQCVKCNRFLSGNVVEYRKGLIRKIGMKKLEWLETTNKERRFDIDYLKRVKKIFRAKARRREK